MPFYPHPASRRTGVNQCPLARPGSPRRKTCEIYGAYKKGQNLLPPGGQHFSGSCFIAAGNVLPRHVHKTGAMDLESDLGLAKCTGILYS